MILIIVESPAKCKKIESYLGTSYKCLASYGHIREFANGLKSVDLKNNYKSTYKISHNKQKYVKVLRSAIKKATEVILATDDDREGEAIAWHICKVFNLPVKTTKRIIFHEITKKAILKAVNHPTFIDMKKVQAQQARQILDIIVGFKTSPILWKYISRKAEKGLSAGRCQTPALRLVYENELEYKKAKGEHVYETLGQFTHMNISYKLNHFFKNKDDVKSFLEKSKSFSHILSIVKKKKMKKSPPKPFTTSTLQQKASNMYNFSPKTTMKLAQTLYENGLITYMRTDNAKYSKDFINSTKDFISYKWNTKYINKKIDSITLNEKTSDDNAANGNAAEEKTTEGKKDSLAQEAHEAIRPTNIETEIIKNNPKIGKFELKLYKLIWKNSLQSCMASSLYDVILSEITSPNDHIYKNTSEKNIFPGWEILDEINKSNDIFEYLYSISSDKKITFSEIKSEMAIKKLKSHYSEARLVQLLEKNGIGRPSTFSSLVSKILERNYVVKTNIPGKKLECTNFILQNDEINEANKTKIFGEEKNKLKIEPVGLVVIEFLNKHFDNLFNYEYTKSMENHLDNISEGKYSLKKLCDSCINELDTSISSITNNLNMDKKDSSFQKGIKIDDNHTWIIGKFGPVILCNINDNITFKKVKKDIDLDKLKRGEYALKDIIYTTTTSGNSMYSKSLGEFNGEEIIVKKGKFGLYCSYKNKNRSLKYTKKTLETITIEDVKKVLESNNSSSNSKVLKNINEDASVRQGKWGPYVYYKTKQMTKPKFLPIKNIAWKNIDMDWIYDNL